MQPNLQRIVHGNPEQPDSTRDIRGFNPCQYKHLIECLQSGLKEALVFLQLSDTAIQQVLLNMNLISHQFGLPMADFDGISVSDFRAYQEERVGVLTCMLQALNQPYQGTEKSTEEVEWEGDFRVV